MIRDCDLGLMDYREAFARQKEVFDSLREARKNGSTELPDEVLFTVEHNPVYTLGRHADKGNILHRLPGVEFVEILRGGDITFHGPGQLVVYPVIDLLRHGFGVKSYIRTLEETIIRLLAEYSIIGERVEGATGVWIGVGTPEERKICAIGVHCSRFVSMHGLALNVNTDLRYFNAINPCGFVDKGVTSLQRELGHVVPMEEVKTLFCNIFHDLLPIP